MGGTKKSLLFFSLNMSAVVLLFVGTIYLGIFLNSKKTMELELKSRASAIANSFILARRWNASYGGLYVLKRPGMASNPYLANPDMEDNQGRVYTKKNPALMIREISESAGAAAGFDLRITSLQPLNPHNDPDPFERAALMRFDAGENEVFAKERVGANTFYRYMIPLLTESSCLQCHPAYQVGDVRGGLSVRFNIDNFQAALAKNLYTTLFLAVITLGALLLIVQRLIRRLHAKLRKAEEKLERLVVTDELTGLKNRRYLYERLPMALKLARRHRNPVSCIMLDLDHFKVVNDSFGHEFGDRLLVAIAELLRDDFRETDILCRYGGEEFIIVLLNTDLDAATKKAESLRQTIARQRIDLDGENVTVTASFGVAWFDPHAPEAGENRTDLLLKRADVALYRAKNNGRDRVERFS